MIKPEIAILIIFLPVIFFVFYTVWNILVNHGGPLVAFMAFVTWVCLTTFLIYPNSKLLFHRFGQVYGYELLNDPYYYSMTDLKDFYRGGIYFTVNNENR